MQETQDYYGQWTLFHDLFGRQLSIPLLDLHPYGIPFAITRFMVVELVAAVFIALAFIWLAKRIQGGAIARGKRANILEVFLLFIRDQVVRPVMGGPSGDFILPYIWTVFFFVLTCNLLGMIPLIGSPMASIWITTSLALCSLVLMHAVPIAKLGLWNYLKTMWIPIDIPVFGLVVGAVVFVIEFLGTFIKGLVLGLRLFANIFVGHVVLATIISFAGGVVFMLETVPSDQLSFFTPLGALVVVASLVGGVLLSILELFVAFLQAYVFALLSALFIGLPLAHHAQHEAEHGHHDHGHPHDEHETAHAH